MRVECVGELPAADQAGNNGDNHTVEDKPAQICANLRRDSDRTRRGRYNTMRQQQADKQRVDISNHFFVGKLLKGIQKRRKHDIGRPEINGDGHHVAQQIDREVIMLGANLAQQEFRDFLQRTGGAEHLAEDTAEDDDKARACHGISKPAADKAGQLAHLHA